MNDIRVARLRMIGDRWLRAAAGCAWILVIWLGIVRLLSPEFFDWRRESLVAICALWAFYADAVRPPSLRGFKQLVKASHKALERTVIPVMFAIILVLDSHLVLEDSAWWRVLWLVVDRVAIGLVISGLIALVGIPFLLPIMALLDRWQIRQEGEFFEVIS